MKIAEIRIRPISAVPLRGTRWIGVSSATGSSGVPNANLSAMDACMHPRSAAYVPSGSRGRRLRLPLRAGGLRDLAAALVDEREEARLVDAFGAVLRGLLRLA